MGAKKEQQSEIENGVEKYELRAPDGGWGYVIVLATIIIFSFTVVPMTAFGLIFGKFLQSIGDEITGTTLSNGMFNTANSFTGLIANGVLNRYSYRKVGFAGSLIFFLGAICLVFCQNLIHVITFFGVVEGIGFGLMMPAVFSAFNSYFNEKMAVMMSIAQAVMVVCSMIFPQIVTWSMEILGFRGTLIGLAALGLLCVPVVFTLQPVKWHMKKVPIETLPINDTVISVTNMTHSKKSLPADILKAQFEPLVNQEKQLTLSQRSLHERVVYPKPRRSVISLADRMASVTTINDLKDEYDGDEVAGEEDLSIWQSFVKSMDMSLLKDPKYLITSTGLALCFTSDMAFISIIPLMLANCGFDSQQIALIITVYFGADLVARIVVTVISGLFKIRSKTIVLLAALVSTIFRVVLFFNDTYIWKMSILAVLGFLRAFIQTPLPLVISEEYPDLFSTAFSLYMAVNGVVSLVFGLLMSFIKSFTHSDIIPCHALTVAFGICVIAWITEMTVCRKKPRDEEQPKK